MFPVVAEIGSRGGGIASCLALSADFSWAWLAALELLRFQDRLNFLRRVVIEEGVVGSSGLDSCVGDFGVALMVGFETDLDGCL
jgi:hypothetical protein